MPDHLRSLVVILAISAVVFAFAKAPACAVACTVGDFERRRNLWFAITFTAFLSHNFWIYIVVTAVILLFALPREPNKLAMFFFLLFALPAVQGEIPGLGIANYFFIIHYPRLLAMTVLMSAFLFLRKSPDVERFGRSMADKLIACFIVLNVLLQFRSNTLAEGLRSVVFGAFFGTFLPYYVSSRAPRKLQDYRDVLMAFVIAAMVIGAIGVFEAARYWWLYTSLQYALGVKLFEQGYLLREGSLRAAATTGHPLVLGYVMVVAIGFFLYLKTSIAKRKDWVLGMMLLVAGLVAPLSRGPWVGAAVIVAVFIATGPAPGRAFAKLGLLGLIAVPALLLSPVGEKFVNLLPFVGTVEQDNVSYRSLLLEVSLQVMMENLYLGSDTFLQTPAMQVLMQGQGMIDLVNTYLVIGLSNGVIGLALFSSFFVAVIASIFKAMRSVSDRGSENYLLGRALLSTLLGILVIIFTVSPISVIPTIYWSVAGLGVAYVRMLSLAPAAGAARPAKVQPTVAARAA